MSFLKRLFGGGGASSDGDAAVIAQLEAAGADLSLPRPVDFFLYFPTEEDARAAGAWIEGPMREVTVGPAARGHSWLVHVVETMVVDLAAMHARRVAFDTLTSELSGEYDGWGAPA